MTDAAAIAKIGLVGARGHTGRELIRLIAMRPDMELVFAGSREFAGRPVREMAPEAPEGLDFEAIAPDDIAGRDVDAVILALPNGAAAPFVDAIEAGAPQLVLVDLSADYRFSDDWTYGLPEAYGRDEIVRARRIANPGCYATAGQLAIAPVRDRMAGPVHVFGVSGYSGAGTTPSRKNDVEALRDNIMPYALSGHIHEAEMARQLGVSVNFTPHVAPAFRGLITTVHLFLDAPESSESLRARYESFYGREALVEIQAEPPELRDGSGRLGAVLGGFALSRDGRRAVIVSALDNLLKGAAVQAMQNLALALDRPEFAIPEDA